MEENFLFIFIYYPSIEKENPSDISFIIPDNKNRIPKCIYSEETFIDDNNKYKKYYSYKKIYKFNISKEKEHKMNNYYFEFKINDYKYIISFENKDSSFIYDVNLEIYKRNSDIKRTIDQNIIDYNKKFCCFVSALEQDGEKIIIDELYKDSINLYLNQKGFDF